MAKLKYMMRSISVLILLGLFWAEPARAQVHEKLALDSILEYVKHNNLSLKEIEAQVQAVQAKLPATRAWMAPMAGFGTFMTPYPGQMVMSHEDKGSVMLSLEQEIPNPVRQKARLEAAQQQVAFITAGKAVRQNELLTAARYSYRQLVLLQYNLQYQEESKKILQSLLAVSKIRYTYNQGNLQDTYLNEARLAETESMISMLRAQVQQETFRLRALMNLPESAVFSIADSTWKSPALNQPDSASILGRRSDLQQMEASIGAMKAEQHLMSLGSRPDFKIKYDHMSPLAAGMPQQYSVMGMVSIPIAPWSSRMYKSEVKAMQWEIQAMQYQQANMAQESWGMIRGMYYNLLAMQRQQELYAQSILPNLEKALQLEQVAYQEGSSTLLQVLNAWENLNMARMKFQDQWLQFNQMLSEYERELDLP